MKRMNLFHPFQFCSPFQSPLLWGPLVPCSHNSNSSNFQAPTPTPNTQPWPPPPPLKRWTCSLPTVACSKVRLRHQDHTPLLHHRSSNAWKSMGRWVARFSPPPSTRRRPIRRSKRRAACRSCLAARCPRPPLASLRSSRRSSRRRGVRCSSSSSRRQLLPQQALRFPASSCLHRLLQTLQTRRSLHPQEPPPHNPSASFLLLLLLLLAASPQSDRLLLFRWRNSLHPRCPRLLTQDPQLHLALLRALLLLLPPPRRPTPPC